MESNPQLELAYDFLEYTGVNVFLTGKAGTGKIETEITQKDDCGCSHGSGGN